MQEVSSVEVAPSLEPARERVPARRKRWWAPGGWLLLSAAALVFTPFVQSWLGDRDAARIVVGVIGYGSSVLFALWSVLLACVKLARPPKPARSFPLLEFFGVTLTGLAMALFGALFGLFSTFGFSRGRQLRRRGRVLLPTVREGGAWASSGFVLEHAAAAPLGLADQWRENGRTEHASVASFARLTLDLMAFGAPPELVTAAQQDALDEIRHAEACFSLAQAIDGRSASPGPFPEAQSAHTLPRTRVLGLAALAVTSLVDGALHEGVSARIIAKLGRRCANPTIAGVLKGIAADEGRHAAHGWEVVEWCLAEGGRAVAQALLGATRVLPAQMRSQLPQAATDGAWVAWGIHDQALEIEEYAATRAHVVQRVHALVAGHLAKGAARAA
jgi:hypothetical protein